MISYHRAKCHFRVLFRYYFTSQQANSFQKDCIGDVDYVFYIFNITSRNLSLFRLLIKSQDVSQLVSDENPISTNWEANLL